MKWSGIDHRPVHIVLSDVGVSLCGASEWKGNWYRYLDSHKPDRICKTCLRLVSNVKL